MYIKDYIADGNISVLESMRLINANSRGIIYICEGIKLQGVVTDGNIRRHILKNGNLDDEIKTIMNTEPKFIKNGDNTDAFEYMKANSITSVPIVNSKHEIIAIKFLNAKSAYRSENLDVPVVIMAGGKGTRLQPYTDVLPKPLIPIYDETITELIMSRFNEFGCSQFKMIVNYKKQLIKAFFSEVDKPYDVTFLEEQEFLGTAGGLKLLDGCYDSTFFLTNCDVLVEADYSNILKYHKENKSIITMVCAAKKVSIPYGTVHVNGNGNVERLDEKPNFSFLANTGVYVIEPRFLEYIPDNTFIHITEVIEACMKAGETIGMYPISENAWFDMGQMNELERMRKHIERKEATRFG